MAPSSAPPELRFAGSSDYPVLRYRSTLEPVGASWLAVEAKGSLETPISGDDLARLRPRKKE